jgi:capsular polysaccharide biosynthesis protein
MTLPDTFRALRRRHVLLEVAALVSVVLALGLGLRSGTEYKAQTQVLLTQNQVFLPGDQGILTQQKLNLLVLNYSQIVATPEFTRVALDRAGLEPGTASGIKVSGSAFQNASIVKVEIAGGSKSRVLSTANALQSSLLRDLKDDQASIDASQQISARVLEVPTAVVSSANLVFTVFAALVVGLMLAATVALLLENE